MRAAKCDTPHAVVEALAWPICVFRARIAAIAGLPSNDLLLRVLRRQAYLQSDLYPLSSWLNWQATRAKSAVVALRTASTPRSVGRCHVVQPPFSSWSETEHATEQSTTPLSVWWRRWPEMRASRAHVFAGSRGSLHYTHRLLGRRRSPEPRRDARV